MSTSETISCDILVVGSGFGGALAALCLNRLDFEVCVLEKDRHPRFAIGESSTPIADMILRELSDRYDLPWLHHFSRYGSWQQHYPDITCGIKRGFSYFNHEAGKPFTTNAAHEQELLVTSSISDGQSDTNWMRSGVDAFLVQKLRDYGICYRDQTEITNIHRDKRWKVRAHKNEQSLTVRCAFFIDATGSSRLLDRFLDVRSSAAAFRTHSRALFSHFHGVKKWQGHLHGLGIETDDHPYRADCSALHHLLDEGWMWMLRFNDDTTSAGIVFDMNKIAFAESVSPTREWRRIIEKYPSLGSLFEQAELADRPGSLIRTKRLQRRLDQAAGPGWAALPHTAGFIDPLHSTGIAHTLSGLEKLLQILPRAWNDAPMMNRMLAEYERSVFLELEFVDLLVAGCYRSMQHFRLFSIYTMLYFTAAIHYEQERLAGDTPSHFLSAGNSTILDIVHKSYKELDQMLDGNPAES